MGKSNNLLARRMKFDKIREIAEDVRQKNWDRPQILPVPIEEIIEFKLKIEIIPKQGLKSESDVEGFLSNDLSTIFVDALTLTESKYLKRLRFTLAHELGHFFLHGDIIKKLNFSNFEEWVIFTRDIDSDDLDWFERQANEFAGRFLIPRDPLLKSVSDLKPQIESYIKKCFKDEIDIDKDFIIGGVSKKICERYMVSHEVIKRRIYTEEILKELDIDKLFK